MTDQNGTVINSTGVKDNPTVQPATPTPTPIPTPTPVINVTATPKPTPKPTPNDNVDMSKMFDNTGLPLNPIIPILAVIVVGLLIIKRRE